MSTAVSCHSSLSRDRRRHMPIEIGIVSASSVRLSCPWPATPGHRCRGSWASRREAASRCWGARRDSTTRLGELPARVEVRASARGSFDVVVAVHHPAGRARAPLRTAGPCHPSSRRAVGCLAEAGSGVPTDLDENTVRDVALPRGLVDNKVCAIDETWSGLRLVIRRENR